MPATPIVTPLPEERLVGIEPQLLQQVADGWRHRLNLFTGRALTDTALTNEQLYRAGLLATLGQSVAPGVLSGLALSMQVQGTDAVLSIAPGYGISAVGEDVLLPRTLTTNLSTLAVVDPASGAIVAPFSTYVKGTSASSAGVLLLQPVTAQATGAELDTGPIIASGNLSDSPTRSSRRSRSLRAARSSRGRCSACRSRCSASGRISHRYSSIDRASCGRAGSYAAGICCPPNSPRRRVGKHRRRMPLVRSSPIPRVTCRRRRRAGPPARQCPRGTRA